jgi:hypothetical protein
VSWSRPPSDTEQEKAENAARMIRDALRADPGLTTREFEVYPSGSYRNNTNVRQDSDVDVAVVLMEAFFSSFPEAGTPTRALLGLREPGYGFSEFREDVGTALVNAFGVSGVTAGDKAFDIHENTYRLDADAAVFLEHRRYTGQQDNAGDWTYHSGVELRPRADPGKQIINWHQQHYDNGVTRNAATRRRFKRVTRILKRLRNEMREEGDAAQSAAAEPIASFLIESLVYGAPDTSFNLQADGYYEDTKAVVRHLWHATKPDAGATYSQLPEVNEMKYLFHATQPWTVAQAHEFLLRAWQYVGFGG